MGEPGAQQWARCDVRHPRHHRCRACYRQKCFGTARLGTRISFARSALARQLALVSWVWGPRILHLDLYPPSCTPGAILFSAGSSFVIFTTSWPLPALLPPLHWPLAHRSLGSIVLDRTLPWRVDVCASLKCFQLT